MFETNQQEINTRYLGYHEDGFLDILTGLGVLFAGLFMLAELPWMVAVFVPIFLPVWQKARGEFVHRRVGHLDNIAKTPVQEQTTLLWGLLFMGIIFLAGLGAFFALEFAPNPLSSWIKDNILMVMGAVFGSVWVFAGRMLNLNRLFIYAVLTMGIFTVVQFAAWPFWLALTVLGTLILSFGLIVMLRFVRTYPVEQ